MRKERKAIRAREKNVSGKRLFQVSTIDRQVKKLSRFLQLENLEPILFSTVVEPIRYGRCAKWISEKSVSALMLWCLLFAVVVYFFNPIEIEPLEPGGAYETDQSRRPENHE